jgi:hypothetical protein
MMRLRRWRSLLLAATSAVLVGCTSGDAEAGGGVAVTVDTINSVVHVTNTGAPAVWLTRELFTIGEVVGVEASPQEFGRISGVIADGDGNVFVADAAAAEIRVFDAQSKLVRRIGRRGAGPGEFGNLQSIGWLGDTLVVMDASNARLGMLSRTGEWLGQRPHDRITGGDIRLHQTGLHELYTPASRRVAQGLELAFARHTSSGVLDTVPAPYDTQRGPTGVMCQYSGGISFWNVEYAPRTLRLPGPASTRVDVWSGAYRIALMSAQGDTLRVLSRDVPTAAVTDAEWATEEERYRKWKAGLPPNSTCQPATLPRPESKDLIRGVYFDDAGRIWVNLRKQDGFAFDVFDAEGRLLGSMDVPARVERIAPHIRANRLYIVTADSMDVQFVKAFEVRNQGS